MFEHNHVLINVCLMSTNYNFLLVFLIDLCVFTPLLLFVSYYLEIALKSLFVL